MRRAEIQMSRTLNKLILRNCLYHMKCNQNEKVEMGLKAQEHIKSQLARVQDEMM